MASLHIIEYPDSRLRKPCAPVEAFDEELAALAEQMLRLMRRANGVGLAAPQVGVNLRLFVCNVTGKPEDDRIYVNPELSDLAGSITGDEGCLSIPNVTVSMRRASSCTLEARDIVGKPVKASGKDLIARCWQHEADHLDGRLIIDRMSDADAIANRKALKELEARFKKQQRAR